MTLLFNKYGVGVPLSDSFIFSKLKIKEQANKWLIDNFNDSFKLVTIDDLPDNYYDYYWIKWNDLDSGIDRAEYRRELHTPMRYSIKDVLEYDGYEELLPYGKSYFITFPIEYIKRMCTKYLGGFVDKKILVLGCGTGECLLMLEAYGMHATGMELNKYAFKYANPLSISRMIFGDFLVDTNQIQDKSYDVVFSNMLSWVTKNDILPLLIEINRIGYLFIQDHLLDGNSYKIRRKSWWQKQFNSSGMSYLPNTTRVALCRGLQNG